MLRWERRLRALTSRKILSLWEGFRRTFLTKKELEVKSTEYNRKTYQHRSLSQFCSLLWQRTQMLLCQVAQVLPSLPSTYSCALFSGQDESIQALPVIQIGMVWVSSNLEDMNFTVSRHWQNTYQSEKQVSDLWQRDCHELHQWSQTTSSSQSIFLLLES